MMGKHFLIIIMLLMCVKIQGSIFENQLNHFKSKSITQLKVYGERCTGTNYIYYLMHANFPDLQESKLLEYGNKHFLWWFGTPYQQDKVSKLKYNDQAVYFNNTSHCLFVVVVRNPYDWIRSFYLSPHHVHKDLVNKGFSNFISAEWKLNDKYHPLDGCYGEIDNLNPFTGKPFRNVWELRNSKNINYLKLGSLVNNFLVVKYEDVNQNPQEFIEYVAKKYKLTKTKEYKAVNNYKGSHVPYIQNSYFPLNMEELLYINSELDWNIENLCGGYYKKESID